MGNCNRPKAAGHGSSTAAAPAKVDKPKNQMLTEMADIFRGNSSTRWMEAVERLSELDLRRELLT